MFEQDVVELTETNEVEFVPDLNCPNPNCGKAIFLDRELYAWFRGEIPCGNCHCVVLVTIGAWGRNRRTGRATPTVVPFGEARGGHLLEPPTVVKGADTLPDFLPGGLGSNVPDDCRAAFQTAIRHFNNLDYLESGVGCRITAETALMGLQGVPRRVLVEMAKRAKDSNQITEVQQNLCLVISTYGGDSAHPQQDRRRMMDRPKAMLLIDMTAGLLRELFPSPVLE